MARSFYPYEPSLAAAAVLCALFGASFLISAYQFFRYRSWVWIVMVVSVGSTRALLCVRLTSTVLLTSCVVEFAGYAARTVSASNTTARTIFIVQFCLIILAPVLMAGVIYVLFGRIVFYVVPAPSRTLKLLWVPRTSIPPSIITMSIAD